MNIKKTSYWINKLEEKYDSLKDLGDKDTLISYLKEELQEIRLSDSWDKLEQQYSELQDNPNNILIYYLNGTHKKPDKLQHFFTGGDYPDIDLDFEPEARQKIKQYLKDRFGEKNCMEVVTLQGIKAKGAIQDLARISGLDMQKVYPVTTSIKYNVNDESENSIEFIMEHNQKVREFLNNHPEIKENIEKMKGVIRGYGTHASAFIISSVPIDEYIPVVLNKEKELVTGYTESSHIDALNKVGLIKFDILGLKNLTIIRETEEKIYEDTGVKIDWNKIDINDPEVYKVVRSGLLGGVFQLDSNTAYGVLKTIEPTSFEDLVAANALIRPACLYNNSHIAYKNHKIGRFDRQAYPVWQDLKGKISDFTYNLLDTTYGIILYQEQVMALLAEFCGLTFDETNQLRKIIAKPDSRLKPEDREYVKEQKRIFLENAAERIGPDLALQWLEVAVGSLSYSFNRSHSVAYSMTAFRQLFLKRYYPQQFYWALLKTEVASSSSNKKSSLMQYIIEAKKLGVDVEPPNINKSKAKLDYSGDSIYIGFEQIKSVGPAAVVDIVKNAPYKDFDDFIAKHKNKKSAVNKKVVYALIVSGCFSDWGSKQELLQKWAEIYKVPDYEVPTKFQLLKEEREHLSIVLSEKDALQIPAGYHRLSEAIEKPKGRKLKIKGIVDKIEKLKSKAGNNYIKMTLNDFENTVYILVWRNLFRYVSGIEKGDIVRLKVKHLEGDAFSLEKVLDIQKEQDT